MKRDWLLTLAILVAPLPVHAQNSRLARSASTHRAAAILSGKPFDYGVNATFKVKTAERGKQLFKPRYGEDHSYHRQNLDAKSCPLYKREVLASEISDLLHLSLVPRTRVMRVNRRDARKIGLTTAGVPSSDVGSAQDMIEGFEEAEFLAASSSGRSNLIEKHWNRLVQMAAYDDIVGNLDRHANNWGTDKQGKPWLIDNGYAFHIYKKPDEGIRLGRVPNGQFAVLGALFLDRNTKSFRTDPLYYKTIRSFYNKRKEIKALFKRYGLPAREQEAFFARIAYSLKAVRTGEFAYLTAKWAKAARVGKPLPGNKTSQD